MIVTLHEPENSYRHKQGFTLTQHTKTNCNLELQLLVVFLCN